MAEKEDQTPEELQRRIGELERELVAMHGSLSWRLTKPLRTSKRLARGRRRLRSGFTTTILSGGLGNQLFQYAAGLRVAEQTGTRLRVDRTVLGRDGMRPYRLDTFVKCGSVSSPRLFDYEMLIDTQRFAEFAADRYAAPVVRERSDGGIEELAEIEGDSVLVGYWQSERYFEEIRDLVRQTLRLRKVGGAASEVEQAIERSALSAAVHVRRGDYVSSPRVAAMIGYLGADYYRSATAVIETEAGTVDWFVFSDDVQWCKANLRLNGNVTYVSGGTSDAEDLHLISRCDHAVIANSSFSWWGAWLGESQGSIVVAPENWAANPEILSRPSVVPDRWRRVANALLTESAGD